MKILMDDDGESNEKDTLIIIEDKSKENTFFSQGVKSQVKVSLAAFNRSDDDKDGSIGMAEFIGLLKHFDSNYDYRHVKSILDKYLMNTYSTFTFQDLLTVINDLSVYQKSLDY